mmetsp:Transcript_5815/g.22085  ORF Transcript_5815/g.22085 Transcript_5815/m.22085 type:complete len:364 (-) Transcript_5815:146-1237(-)
MTKSIQSTRSESTFLVSKKCKHKLPSHSKITSPTKTQSSPHHPKFHPTFDHTLLHNHYLEDILLNLQSSLHSRMPYNWLKLLGRFQIADDLLFVCTRFSIESPDVKFNALWLCVQYLQLQRARNCQPESYFPVIYLCVAISIKYHLSTVLSFADILSHLKQFGVFSKEDARKWTKETLLTLELDILGCLEYKVRAPHLWNFVYAMLSCFMNPLANKLESTRKFVQSCQDAAEMLILRARTFDELDMRSVVATIVSCGNILYHERLHWRGGGEADGREYSPQHLQRNKCLISTWISQVTQLKREQATDLGEKLYSYFDSTRGVVAAHRSVSVKKDLFGARASSNSRFNPESIVSPDASQKSVEY